SRRPFPPTNGYIDERRSDLDRAASAAEPFGRDELATASRERLEDQLPAPGVLFHWDLEESERLLRRMPVPDDALLPLPVDLPDRAETVFEVVRRLVPPAPSEYAGLVGPSVVGVRERRRRFHPDDGLVPQDPELLEDPIDDRVLEVRVPDVDP